MALVPERAELIDLLRNEARSVETDVASLQYENRRTILTSLTKGGQLRLGRDYDNPCDPNAILVAGPGGDLGFIPRRLAKLLAPEMDAGARGGGRMRGVGLYEFGGPEVLRVVDLPEVHAGRGEVRIRVYAASVNPTDVGLRNGSRAEALREIAPPHVPGMDVAGVVDEVGPDTETELAVGDAVMAMVIPRGTHGAYRESIVLAADSVVRAPARASHVEAATLPMNGLTARQSLYQLALQPGQAIAVTGAAGCYGGYVVQLAKAEGLRVIADASPADEQLVRDLGVLTTHLRDT